MQDLPPERLRALWMGQLTAEDQPSLRVPATSGEPEPTSAATAVSWAEAHLFERRSVVGEHELWRHALEFARGSALTLADLKRETASRDYIREANGKLTRKDVLAREWKIIQMAKQRSGRFAPLASHGSQPATQLPDDQQRAFYRIVASRDFVTLFRGGAGTGKSYVLRGVQRAISITFAASLAVFTGCTWWKDHHLATVHSTEQEYAHLLELYQSGKIDAEQLTSRQNALAIQRDQALARAAYERAHPTPEPDTSSSTGTHDEKCKNLRHQPEPGKPCPPVPGRH